MLRQSLHLLLYLAGLLHGLCADLPDEVEVEDLGTPGLDLHPHLAGHAALIIVDTVRAKAPPGTLRRYRAELLRGELPVLATVISARELDEAGLEAPALRSLAEESGEDERTLLGAFADQLRA